MKHLQATLILLLIIFCLTNVETKAQVGKHFPHAVSINYFGESLTYPGLSVATEFLLKHREKGKREKIIDKLFTVGIKIGGYHHANNHSAFFIQPFLSWQRIGNNGFLLQVETGAGYFIRNNDGIIYRVNSQKNVETMTAARYKFMPSVSAGIGYNFRKKTNFPFSIQIKTGIFLEIPNNKNFLPHKFTEAGISYLF